MQTQKICQRRFWGGDCGTAWQLIEEEEKFTLLEIATAAESVGRSTRSRRWQGVSTLNTIDLWFHSMQTSSTGLRGCRHFDTSRYCVDGSLQNVARYFPGAWNLCDLRKTYQVRLWYDRCSSYAHWTNLTRTIWVQHRRLADNAAT